MSPEEAVYTLEPDTCWGHLASQDVGRIGLITGGRPEILPVNFCLDGEAVLFRSAEGGKLASIRQDDHVVFEADGWNDTGGWSVLVKGRACIVTDPDELKRAERIPMLPWFPGQQTVWVRIDPEEVSGRGFIFGAETDG